jgi:hypothetical protein
LVFSALVFIDVVLHLIVNFKLQTLNFRRDAMKSSKHNPALLRTVPHAIVLCALLSLASCSGDDDSLSNKPAGISGVRVFGDSLADSGTFGLKFTVNKAGDNGAATPIWPELIASQLGVSQLCSFYDITFDGIGAMTVAENPACSSFAVGGARINSMDSMGLNDPRILSYQMDTALSVTKGALPTKELILLDGGGNDAADLLGAYLGAASGTAGVNNYVALLSSLLPAATVASTIGLPATTNNPLTGAQQLGGSYMVVLANKLADDINAKLLAKGANKVAILNVPAITSTPRFQ